MRVKVFEAENMADALKKVKETLGPDALILSTRTVGRKGIGLFGKTGVEVTAAVDPSLDSEAPGGAVDSVEKPSFSSQKPVDEGLGRKKAEDEGAEGLTYDNLWKQFRVEGERESRVPGFLGEESVPSPSAVVSPGENTGSNEEIDSLRNELAELKSLVRGVVNRQEKEEHQPSLSAEKKIFSLFPEMTETE